MMEKRAVRGLRWACELAGKPDVVPTGRARGVKALGVRYERAFAKQVASSARHGVWFEYEDMDGHHYCQVDFLFFSPMRVGRAIIGEAKYTWTQSGHEEIERLYAPVVWAALGVETSGFVVCKTLTKETKGCTIVSTLYEALLRANINRRTVLQWLPKTPLVTPAQHKKSDVDLSATVMRA